MSRHATLLDNFNFRVTQFACLAQTLCVVRPNLDSELFDVRHPKVVVETAKIEISAGKEVGACCVSNVEF